MIGQTIESRPSFPLGAILWLVAAAALDVLAVVCHNNHLAVCSLWPLLAAFLFWLMRDKPFTVRFTETALEVDEPPLQLPYADMQGLLAPRRPANPFKVGPHCYAIQVIHSGGILSIPARLTVLSDEVHSFLYRQFSPSGSREVPQLLRDFLCRKEREYGSEQVWTYRARPHSGRANQLRGWIAFCLSLAFSGIGWILWGIFSPGQEEGWIFAGIAGLFLGGLFAFVVFLLDRESVARIRKGRQSGLVVAPDGLALVQGDMAGQLRWDEVHDVKLGKGRSSFQLTMNAQQQPLRGIVLQVEGAAVVIADIYDRPIALIHQHICYYWRNESADDVRPRGSPARFSSERVRPAAEDAAPPSSQGGIAPAE